MNKKSTINDVAKMAGVSITTVSRAIHGKYPVKKETREKIFDAIEKLEFKPNEIAVSMITKKTKTIGIVIPSITNAFFSTLVRGVNDVAEKNGYTLLVCTSHNNEIELVEKLVNRQIDGIIIADSDFSNKRNFYKKIHKQTPLIFINGYDKQFNFVSCNQKKGTIDAINYLNECGHENILFVRGSENSYSYDLKQNIFNELVEYKSVIVVENGNKDEAVKNAEKEIIKFFSKNKKITAVFACNDLMAIGVIKGLERLNINVPNDVAVIGFDNTFLCDLVTPKISTVDQNIYNLGKISCESILNIIEENVKINITLDSELIIRESS